MTAFTPPARHDQNLSPLSTRWVRDSATLAAEDMERRPIPLGKARTRLRTWGETRRALLRERGVSLTDIARTMGKDLSSVSRVIRGERRSQLIEQEIARRLSLSVADAFPEWNRTRSH
jgi:hypothetical protein